MIHDDVEGNRQSYIQTKEIVWKRGKMVRVKIYFRSPPPYWPNQSMKVKIYFSATSALFLKFIYYWPGTVVHLLLLKFSITKLIFCHEDLLRLWRVKNQIPQALREGNITNLFNFWPLLWFCNYFKCSIPARLQRCRLQLHTSAST